MTDINDEDGSIAVPQGPLLTREVFLDTEVYRRYGLETNGPSITALLSHIADQRLELHFTDITLNEIRRQLVTDAEKMVDEVRRARRTLAKWQTRAPGALCRSNQRRALDATRIGNEAFETFRRGMAPFNIHRASEHPAAAIFEAYFARRAPFDADGGKSVKEFPDAFAIAALGEWCTVENTLMYVVTSDKAMLRAAQAHEKLVPVAALEDLLQIVTVQHSPDVRDTVRVIMEAPEFEEQLGQAIDRCVDDMNVLYLGDLNDGEASNPARVGNPSVTDWTVISAFDKRYGVIIDCDVELRVQVTFDDWSMASYDSEDKVMIGGTNDADEVEEEVNLRMFVQVDETFSITRAEILTPEVRIYGPHDY